MKRANILSMILFTILLVSPIQNGLVYNQLEGQAFFDVETCQLAQQLQLGTDFEQTQQFAIWGWIQPTQNVPAISNIVSLFENNQLNTDLLSTYSTDDSVNRCEENNEKLQFEQREGAIKDLVSINYELNEDLQTFNIGFTFLDQNGEYKYEAIQDLPRNDDVQTYFAFSADYQSGIVVMYVRTMDGSAGNYRESQVNLSNQFITGNDYLVLGGTNQFLYTTYTQYIGSISNVQMSRFFLSELDYQWAGYIPTADQNNVLLDFDYNVDDQQQVLRSAGLYNIDLPLNLNSKPLFELDNNKVGIRYYENSQLNLGNIDFRMIDSSINGALFYFDMMFSDDLNDNHVLLTRGNPNQSGFMQISLAKINNSRLLRVFLKGDDTTELIAFDSPQDLSANQRHQFMIGVAQGPSDSLLPIYIDLQNNSKIGPYVENYPFDFGAQNTVMFNPAPQQQPQNGSYIDMKRFVILNTISPAINLKNKTYPNVQNIIQNRGPQFQQQKLCQLQSNYYDDASCLLCQNSILGFNNQCVPYCELGTKNGLNDICVLCKNQGLNNEICSEIDQTTWLLIPEDPKEYVLEPTRQVITPNINYPNLIDVYQRNPETNDLTLINDLTLEPKDNNQQVLIKLGDTVVVNDPNDIFVNVKSQDLNPLYDVNRNLLIEESVQASQRTNVVDQTIETSAIIPPATIDNQTEQATQSENLVDPVNVVTETPEDDSVETPEENKQKLDILNQHNDFSKYPIIEVEKPTVYGYPIYEDEDYYFCIDLDNRGKKVRILAYILLLAYAGTALLLLMWTLCCWNKFWDLGGLWKFLLHHWMKLNLVAFFILLAINMPCCVREFLHQLYKYVVSWDHELRHWINNVNDDDRDYNRGFEQRRLPFQFRVEHVKPFILHNLLITFIAQLAIFAIYMVLKLWDCCNVWKKSCLFRWLIFWEFTALIVGYLLFHMRDFVFSGLTWRKAIFSHSYFICCFLIAIFYALVFWLFWLYSLMILLTKRLPFWSDITNVNKFYYFFVGYREDKLARTYDHWVTLAHFVVAMMIGIVIYSPRAQMIVIVAILGVLFVITIILRPWKNMILLACDLIAQIAILVAVVFFLIYAIRDRDGRCITCDDRESVHCWIIVLFLFIGLMLGLLGLLAAMFMDCCSKGKEVVTTQQDIYHYNQENEVINREQHIYTKDRSVYENVNNQNVVMGQNMLGSERVVNQQVYETNNLNQGSYQGDNLNRDVNTYNTSSNQINYNTSVNQVRAVQPDIVDDGSIQNEMLNAMNEKSHVENTLARNNMSNQNQFLQDERNQFYNRINKDSNVDLYQAKNLGANEHVFNDEIKVTKYTKNTHN